LTRRAGSGAADTGALRALTDAIAAADVLRGAFSLAAWSMRRRARRVAAGGARAGRIVCDVRGKRMEGD